MMIFEKVPYQPTCRVEEFFVVRPVLNLHAGCWGTIAAVRGKDFPNCHGNKSSSLGHLKPFEARVSQDLSV